MNGAVEGAFRRHYGHVYGYFRRRLGDPERAEELTQDVFAAAASSLPEERPGDPPVLVWLYAVARRRFADEARRRGRERRLAGMLPTRSSTDSERPWSSSFTSPPGSDSRSPFNSTTVP